MLGPPDETIDDQSIEGEAWLLRRVVPGRYNANGVPESSTFDKDGDEIGTSVTMWLSNDDLVAVSAGHEDFGVIAISVSAARAEGLGIIRTEVEGNPNHCELTGARTKGKKRALAQQSRWVKYPLGFPDGLKSGLFQKE